MNLQDGFVFMRAMCLLPFFIVKWMSRMGNTSRSCGARSKVGAAGPLPGAPLGAIDRGDGLRRLAPLGEPALCHPKGGESDFARSAGNIEFFGRVADLCSGILRHISASVPTIPKNLPKGPSKITIRRAPGGHDDGHVS